MALVDPKTFTIKEAAKAVGISEEIVRLRCREGACPAQYHAFPGTQRGFYLLNQKSLKWLASNVKARPRKEPSDN